MLAVAGEGGCSGGGCVARHRDRDGLDLAAEAHAGLRLQGAVRGSRLHRGEKLPQVGDGQADPQVAAVPPLGLDGDRVLGAHQPSLLMLSSFHFARMASWACRDSSLANSSASSGVSVKCTMAVSMRGTGSASTLRPNPPVPLITSAPERERTRL